MQKTKYNYVLRDTNDNFNYVKTSDEEIKLFQNYDEAVEFNKEIFDGQGLVESIDTTRLYVIEDTSEEADEHYKVVGLYFILTEINRDRSMDWEDYDQTDFEEGLDEWTEYKYIGMVRSWTNENIWNR